MKTKVVRLALLSFVSLLLMVMPSMTGPASQAFDACQDCLNLCQADYQECLSAGLPIGVCWNWRRECRNDCFANECASQ